MMSTTHAAMALAAVILLDPFLPGMSGPAATAAIAGGVFPDLDIVFEHRKTLHQTELYPVATAIATGVALLSRTVVTISVAIFLGAAALHTLSDVIGGGLGLRPWANDDQRGIYLHLAGRWIPPRRWIRYDGAPEDLLFAILLSIPPYLYFGGAVRTLILLGLAGSAVYVLLRKRLEDIYEFVCQNA